MTRFKALLHGKHADTCCLHAVLPYHPLPNTFIPVTVSPMAPYFETVKVGSVVTTSSAINLADPMQSFADVPITADGVDTVSFLEASDGLVNMFGSHPDAGL